ncbi:helix-turn-helix domain-containing protein [Planktosalinus lacus]|uniref:Transcriptional regulator n=1 Tax=Planktosalinus lacus TaxID=1526573 RepID=A0A8J2V9U0_9FLAO|nr:helix-turn-helix transcriptional regulator [Planktosalinus lacus]GGD94432.1 transcriptional regulator [Planktosalinus lacus]
MVNSDAFASRLQKVMDYYGLSSSAFADTIDFNRSSISHLLSGRNKPSLEFVMKVLEKFPEVKLYWLLNGKGNFPDSDPEIEFPKENVSPPSPPLKNESNEKEKPSVGNISGLDPDKNIERVIIFYKDGTFKEYKN